MCVSLISHDSRKPEMLAFVDRHIDFFRQVDIVATSTTGGKLQQTHDGLVVKRVSSGPLGGDIEILDMVERGDIDAVIFFIGGNGDVRNANHLMDIWELHQYAALLARCFWTHNG